MPRFLNLFASPGGRFFLPLTLMRIAFGLFFFASGFNKVFVPANQAQMLETITEAGIFYPALWRSLSPAAKRCSACCWRLASSPGWARWC
ncbi:hypothetical protein [uncultured Erwinia sp.]|uniref:hypothetical protein n=1 Tax=uncultured Erwinia sp. TaxID=246798 RepID=UPI002582FEE3|nr:hypothetical protein [uncultured Erwinia sp.]